MGNPPKINSQPIIVACLLLALFCVNIHKACSLGSIETAGWGVAGNATTRGGGMEYDEDDEEFLMESELSRRILDEKPRLLSYRLLQQQSFCDPTGKYANCDPLRVNKQSRPCTIENRCARHTNGINLMKN